MLTGKALGAAIADAIEKKGVTKADVARHFGVKPPSVQDWINRGTIDKGRLQELWSYFGAVVGPEHWGLGSVARVAEPPSTYLETTLGQAVEVIAHALADLDEIGLELAGGVLASLAKRPDQPESAAQLLATLVEHHTRAPEPSGPAHPSPSRKGQKESAHHKRGERVNLVVKEGGGQKRQLALPLRTVADPFDSRLAPANEREWYGRLKAAPKAKG